MWLSFFTVSAAPPALRLRVRSRASARVATQPVATVPNLPCCCSLHCCPSPPYTAGVVPPSLGRASIATSLCIGASQLSRALLNNLSILSPFLFSFT
jgi:hypothetical protein